MSYDFLADEIDPEFEMNIGFRVLDSVIEEGDCWIWQGYVTSGRRGGFPAMKFGRNGCVTVRRIVVALDGRPALPRQPVMATCGDKRCCNPAHLKVSTMTEVMQKAGKFGALSSFAKRAATAKTKRATMAKLDMTKANEIRASNDSDVVLSAQYGVNRSLIGRIKRGEAWIEYENNPFAGLMRLAA